MKRRFISLTNAELFKMERKHEIRVEIEQYSVHGPLQKSAFKTWKSRLSERFIRYTASQGSIRLYLQVFQTFKLDHAFGPLSL